MLLYSVHFIWYLIYKFMFIFFIWKDMSGACSVKLDAFWQTSYFFHDHVPGILLLFLAIVAQVITWRCTTVNNSIRSWKSWMHDAIIKFQMSNWLPSWIENPIPHHFTVMKKFNWCLLILKHIRALNLYKLGPINGPFPIGKTLKNSQFSKLEIPKFYKLYIPGNVY